MKRMICPICKRAVKRSDREFPFCSERCRLIDLGNWASGTYKISVPSPGFEEGEAPGPPRASKSPGGGKREEK